MKRSVLLAVLCSISLITAVTSCQNDSVMAESERDFERDEKNHNGQFSLVRDEIINREDELLRLESAGLRSYSSSSSFESSIPLYLYYFHGGEKSDHYFGTEAPSGRSRFIDGRFYLYMYQDFNLVSGGSQWVLPLYRHYSATMNDHILSTQSSVHGYKNQGCLGYVYPSARVGTVPLREYYSSAKRNHHYVSRNSEVEYIRNNAKDYVFQGIVGYVYPGTKEDSQKKPDIITAKIISLDSPCEIIFDVKVKAENNYRALSFSQMFDTPDGHLSGKIATLTLPRSYTIVSLGVTFKFQQNRKVVSFSNLEDMQDRWARIGKITTLQLSHFAISSENHLTFEVMEYTAVGNETFRRKRM